MPKKAVAIFFGLAFVGAVLFVFFTFPRTKDEIPKSNNQRPFPSAPQTPPQPNPVPVPETVPHPNTPKVPPGPTLRVMAWATVNEARALEAEADAFGSATGRHASLTIESDPAIYRHDLRQALDSDSPPDVIFISARDFSGLDPDADLADATPAPDSAPRSIAAFTTNGRIKAAPDEFSVTMLFYNPAYFDQAGIGYPAEHWTWDILEADTRALQSLQLKDSTGHPVYPLELNANFDLWNILCTQAGHPALDLDTWHLGDHDTRESQLRGLEIIYDLFQVLNVAAPLKPGEVPGKLFAQQRAALLIAPSDSAAAFTTFHSAYTLLPHDLAPASMARVNGWAVTAKSTQTEAAQDLAAYLACRPLHAGWTSVLKPKDDGSPRALCYQALGQSLVPRLIPKTAKMTQFLDQQIGQLAHGAPQSTDDLYAHIQTTFQKNLPTNAGPADIPAIIPSPKIDSTNQLRGL